MLLWKRLKQTPLIKGWLVAVIHIDTHHERVTRSKSKDSLSKHVTHVENFYINQLQNNCSDSTSAILQGEKFDPRVFVEKLPDIKTQALGMFWKLNKSLHRLHDTSQNFFYLKSNMRENFLTSSNAFEIWDSFLKESRR